MVDVRYPFTFPATNANGSYGNGPITTPSYQITLVDGPRWRESGLITARVAYVDTQGRSDRSYASQRCWYPEGTRLPDADSNWNYMSWAERDYIWQALTGINTGGRGFGDLGPGRKEFYAEDAVYDGWLYIDGGLHFGWESERGNPATVDPDTGEQTGDGNERHASVPPGGGEGWATVAPKNSGYFRLGAPDPGITVEVYARAYTRVGDAAQAAVPQQGELMLVAPTDTNFVPMQAGTTYYVRLVAQQMPTGPVRLTYSNPDLALPQEVPTLVDYSLSWSAPVHDGDEPLKGYTIFTLLGGVLTKKRVGANVTDFVAQLRPGSVVWISAENSVGASEPLSIGRVV